MSEPQPLRERLASEIQRQLDIQAKLGEALLKELNSVVTEGRPIIHFETGAVLDTVYVPDRDWSRCYGHYKGANKDLLAEERERAKLRLLVESKDGPHKVLTDEEYAAEMKLLGMESVKQLSDAELEAEIRARGIRVEDVKERDE